MRNHKKILHRFPRWLVILLAVFGGILVAISLVVSATLVALPTLIRYRLRRERPVQTTWELPERRRKGPDPAQLNQAWPY